MNTLVEELLREDFGLSQDDVRAVLGEAKRITPEIDARLCALFVQSPGYWMRVQDTYDLREAGVYDAGLQVFSDLPSLQVWLETAARWDVQGRTPLEIVRAGEGDVVAKALRGLACGDFL